MKGKPEKRKKTMQSMKTTAATLTTLALLGATLANAGTAAEYLLNALDEAGEGGITLAPGVTLGVALEVEASYARQNGESESDAALATFEVGLEAALAPGVVGKATLLWEEDDTDPIDLDSAVIELGGTEAVPLVLSAGRMFVPFGVFNSFLISDPLTQELGETRQSAVGLGYGTERFSVWIGGFSGELETSGDLENGVLAVTLAPLECLALGGSLITDLGESRNLSDALNEVLRAGGDYDGSAGFSLHFLIDCAPVTLAVEYLGATGSLKWRDADDVETKARPQAWHVDLAYALNDVWTLALRYEGSREYNEEEVPEHQFGGGVSWQANACTTVSVEYLAGRFGADDAGTRHLATTQLAVAF